MTPYENTENMLVIRFSPCGFLNDKQKHFNYGKTSHFLTNFFRIIF